MRGSLIPWSERLPRPFEGLSRDWDSMMERFFGDGGEHWGPSELAPSTNVAETENSYEVTMDLPGLKPEEVKVEVREGHLFVSGERKEEKEEKGKTFHRVERRYGQFQRTIPLPGTFREDDIEAQYKDGVLKVTLPKTEASKPKQIQVKS